MKICLINNIYKPFTRGGAGIVAEKMAEKLGQEGHDVFAISTKPRGVRSAESGARTGDDAGNYRLPSFYHGLDKIPVAFRLFWHIFDMFDFITAFRVRRILQKEKAELVITHNLKGLSYLIPSVARSLDIRHEHVLHDIQLLHPSGLMFYGEEGKIDSLPARFYAFLCRRLFASPDKVVSPSAWLLEMHSRRGFFRDSEKEVRKNEVAGPENGKPETKTKRGGGKIFRFLYVGQIERHKGILLLIDAFKSLRKDPEQEPPELWIAGEGSLSAEAERTGEGAGNIRFLGWDGAREMEWMREADCLVVPSLCYENSPTVIYKAQSVGLPVIASDLGGIGELLDDGKDFLSKPEAKCLKEKMEALMRKKRQKVFLS